MYKYIAVVCALLINSHPAVARSFYYDHTNQYDMQQSLIVHQPVARSYSYRIDRFSKPTNDLVYIPVALQAWQHTILAIPLVYLKEADLIEKRQEIAKEPDLVKINNDSTQQEVTKKPDLIKTLDDNTREVVEEAGLMETIDDVMKKVDNQVTDKDLASTINELEVISEQPSSSEAAVEKSEESMDS